MAPGRAVAALRGGLVVSCQAPPDHPFRSPELIAAVAACAADGGAYGLRLEGAADVRAVRQRTGLPIIGLRKHFRDGARPLITSRYADCVELAGAAADIVAVEATVESEPDTPFEVLVDRAHAELGVAVMADVASYAEGIAAWRTGADLVGTTLAGYTAGTATVAVPDLELVSALAADGVRVVLEGNVHEPGQVTEALRRGAWAVVVGRAVTDPLATTRRFVAALG
jgi:N-acylglucosamine-6-phosphate 2-epimerase